MLLSLGSLLSCNDRESRTKITGEWWGRDTIRKNSGDFDRLKLENTNTNQRTREGWVAKIHTGAEVRGKGVYGRENKPVGKLQNFGECDP